MSMGADEIHGNFTSAAMIIKCCYVCVGAGNFREGTAVVHDGSKTDLWNGWLGTLDASNQASEESNTYVYNMILCDSNRMRN